MPERKTSKPNEELRQLVREEVEAALQPLRTIISELENEISLLKKAEASTSVKIRKTRLKASDIVKLRRKWRLNRTLFGGLFGVGRDEVKSWERGELAPNPKAADLIIHVRGMSKKERNALLESVVAELEEAISTEAPADSQ